MVALTQQIYTFVTINYITFVNLYNEKCDYYFYISDKQSDETNKVINNIFLFTTTYR